MEMHKEERSRIVDALLSYVPKERLDRWLRKPNPSWGGMTPNSLINIGNTGPIWRFIGELRDGYPF
jgi:hypothetical protein